MLKSHLCLGNPLVLFDGTNTLDIGTFRQCLSHIFGSGEIERIGRPQAVYGRNQALLLQRVEGEHQVVLRSLRESFELFDHEVTPFSPCRDVLGLPAQLSAVILVFHLHHHFDGLLGIMKTIQSYVTLDIEMFQKKEQKNSRLIAEAGVFGCQED